MSTKSSAKVSVREGLIRIESAERFQAKPEADNHIHVVIMQKAGKSLRHYTTLRSVNERLSMGEKVWGNYVCYIVDMNVRRTKIDYEFALRDRITKVRIIADIAYQAIDGERVALGVDDALLTLHDEIVSYLKRVVAKLSLDQMNEDFLDGRIYEKATQLQSWTGVSIRRVTVSLEWPKDVIEREKKRKEKEIKQIEEDNDRRRQAILDDQNRIRSHQLEHEDIAHVDKLMEELGIASMPRDMKLKIMAMPREKAYLEIADFIAETREKYENLKLERDRREFEILQRMMNDGTLEEMDMVELGKKLLDRHMNIRRGDEDLVIDSSVLFGGGTTSSKQLPGANSAQKRLPDELEGTE